MEEKLTIQKLSQESGFSVRQIRYYVYKDLIKPPLGRGRYSFYSEVHLDSLRQIKLLRDQGLKPLKIKLRLKSQIPEIYSQYEMMPGLLIYINCDLEREKPKIIKLVKFVLNQSGLLKEKPENRISSIYARYELAPGLLIFIDRDLEKKRPQLMQIIRFILNSAGVLENGIE